jgi:general secretion pathway protein H
VRARTRHEAGFKSWLSVAAENGFTLIELMVVLFIVGLAAAAVVLALPEPGGSVRAEAERFAARASAARDTAILRARASAVRIGRGGYEVSGRAGGAWRLEAHYDWVAGTEARIGSRDDAVIRFDPAGLAEPASVEFARGDGHAVVDIGADGAVHVR